MPLRWSRCSLRWSLAPATNGGRACCRPGAEHANPQCSDLRQSRQDRVRLCLRGVGKCRRSPSGTACLQRDAQCDELERTMMKTYSGLVAACCLGLSILYSLPAQPAPVGERQGEVSVLHGGVGAEDRAAMQAQAADYNLHLTFAAKGSGAYLSDVKVVIRDARGKTLVDTVTSGPWLYAR